MSIFDVLNGKSIRSEAEADRTSIGKPIGDDVRAIDLDAIGTTEEDGLSVGGDRGPHPTVDAEKWSWVSEEAAEREAAGSALEFMVTGPDIVFPEWGRPFDASTDSSSFVDPPEFVAAVNHPHIEAVDLPSDPPAALAYSGWL